MTLEERITALAARHRTELPEDLRRAIVDFVWEVASLTRCDAEEEATAQEREACAGVAEAQLCEPLPGYREAVAVSNTTAEVIARAIRARGKP